MDAGDGRTVTLVLWESEAHAEAARAVLEPESQRVLGPLSTVPGRFVARGPVLRTDLVTARVARRPSAGDGFRPYPPHAP